MEAPKSEPSTPLLSSFKHRITHSLCRPCCFGKQLHNRHQRLIGIDSDDSDDDDDNNSTTITTTRTSPSCSPKSSSSHSSATIFRRAAHHHHPHETLKHFLTSRLSGGLGRGQHHHGRRGHSADFRYDAISYALNFDPDGHLEDEFPLSRFPYRLPHSPDNNPSSSSSTTTTTTNGHTSPDNNPTTTTTAANGHIL